MGFLFFRVCFGFWFCFVVVVWLVFVWCVGELFGVCFVFVCLGCFLGLFVLVFVFFFWVLCFVVRLGGMCDWWGGFFFVGSVFVRVVVDGFLAVVLVGGGCHMWFGWVVVVCVCVGFVLFDGFGLCCCLVCLFMGFCFGVGFFGGLGGFLVFFFFVEDVYFGVCCFGLVGFVLGLWLLFFEWCVSLRFVCWILYVVGICFLELLFDKCSLCFFLYFWGGFRGQACTV